MTDRLLGKAPSGSEGETIGAIAADGQGRLIGRRYRLISPVGRGGMGVVWRAHDVLLDRDVAVKELILPHGLDRTGRRAAHRRMMREARSAARLSHPGIVTVHDVVEDDGRPWIVMELLRSWSLEQAVRRGGPVPVAQVAEIGIRVLDALRHAHAAGVLHRDVKPGNVLLTPDRVVLTDFGIATLEGDVTHTQTGLLMGSPAYIPPERLSGLPVTQAGDLWSFGATLYTAVEGRPPYNGPDAVAVLGMILTQEPGRPQRAGALITVIEGLLRKDPADRMTAAQASDLLERVLRSHGSAPPERGLPVRSASPGPVADGAAPERPVPPRGRRPLSAPSSVPSRIVETPSGPMWVPYDPPPEPADGRPAPPTPAPQAPQAAWTTPAARAAPPGPAAPDPGSTAPVTASPAEPVGPPGGNRRGYEALRASAVSGLEPPPDGTASPGAAPPGPFSGPSAGTPRGAGRAGPGAGGGRRSAGRAAARASPVPGRSAGRRGSRRRVRDDGWIRDGRPTTRLLVVGGIAALITVLAVTAATLLVLSSDAADAGAPPPVSSHPAPAPPPRAEVPEGYRVLSGGRVSAALPEGWTATAGDGGAVAFSGPANSDRDVTVAEVPAGDPVTVLRRADRGGLGEYTEIGVRTVRYHTWRAADWEYTYVRPGGTVPMHGLTRCVAVGGRTAYLITFATQDLDWAASSRMRRVFLDTFAASVGPRAAAGRDSSRP
ncbi:hypothetical protein GCM10017673_07230 [Streptosporangium violaceochromogenes]|nr:hypothetical protein GCM10017673_07230 [Streptosporangium violaceochromogenes]